MSAVRRFERRPAVPPVAAEPAPWMADAACVEVPTERVDFTAERVDSKHLTACAEVCARCLVLAECRAFADRHSCAVSGVWGGAYYSRRDRRELVRVA